MKSCLFAAAVFGSAVCGVEAAAQTAGSPTTPEARGVFAMHVAVGPGKAATPSFGLVKQVEGRSVMTGRRVLEARCKWAVAADLPLAADDFVAVRSPAAFASPEQFGAFNATLFSALAASKGGEPQVEQHGCIRVLTTVLAKQAAGTR